MLTTDYNWPPLSLWTWTPNQTSLHTKWMAQTQKQIPAIAWKMFDASSYTGTAGKQIFARQFWPKIILKMALNLKYFILVGKIIGILSNLSFKHVNLRNSVLSTFIGNGKVQWDEMRVRNSYVVSLSKRFQLTREWFE